MNERIKNKSVLTCLILFTVLIIVHGFEAIVLRMDETVLGENFINKVFGIIVVFAMLFILKKKPAEIGFTRKGFGKGILTGLLLAAASFAVSYSLEIAILRAQGQSVELGIFTSGFSLTGDAEIHTGIGFILMCVFFNIINVVMEEGTFRGLFYNLVRAGHTHRFAMIFQAVLFGVWHIVTPLHNLIDGTMDIGSFIGLSIGYIILAGLMGIKWTMLYKMTGNLYAGMADHFFNNCIATNLLHVMTGDGIDDMMIVRVLIAQVISFTAVMIFSRIRCAALKQAVE